MERSDNHKSELKLHDSEHENKKKKQQRKKKRVRQMNVQKIEQNKKKNFYIHQP